MAALDLIKEIYDDDCDEEYSDEDHETENKEEQKKPWVIFHFFLTYLYLAQ